jgi:tetratricopeptide (TPR) repeat protein
VIDIGDAVLAPLGVGEGGAETDGRTVVRYVRHRTRDGRGGWVIRLPTDAKDELPADLAERLAKSEDPLALGEAALADGARAMAALAFCEAIERDTECAASRRGLGDTLLALGEFAQAAAEYREALDRIRPWDETGPAPVAGRVRIDALSEAVGKWAEGRPEDERVWFLRGYLALRTGGDEANRRAADCFRRALDLDPDSSHAMRLLREAWSR